MSKLISSPMSWNAGLYDDKHDFVFKYGEDLVELLKPQPGEQILDLGCGTGYLSQLIADAGARVTGVDSSASMIEKAQREYPALDFQVMSATDLGFDNELDAVFSNAVLHWVLESEQAAAQMYKVLKKGGRLVLEMGGKGNVKNIVDGICSVLLENGYTEQASRPCWYFPSLGEYSSLLEQQGFRVKYAVHYDRETLLKDEEGMRDWIRMFGRIYMDGVPKDQEDNLISQMQEKLRTTNFYDGQWWGDYKRLRLVAEKL